jgi:hypothetical protein
VAPLDQLSIRHGETQWIDRFAYIPFGAGRVASAARDAGGIVPRIFAAFRFELVMAIMPMA